MLYTLHYQRHTIPLPLKAVKKKRRFEGREEQYTMEAQSEKSVPGVVRLREMLADPKKTGQFWERS